ncbi:hypothetical protein N9085_01350 [Akkermansiaceae bacterium]|nr:hypothetical protein [Akkermansiaceae bacterium]MDB4356869.1 hypothetical protein [Akkermansiaceae bacterium]MDB4416784.1 hypothetical protein [bacterium]MDB4544140.1 hypothetical protein [bacterium]MDB4585454.1 hypothetical protein [Akkermansiaceae bacterium]
MKHLSLLLALSISTVAAEDLILADFEQETYGNWLIAGHAFGKGPTHGKVADIKNFLGKGFVSSQSKDDKLTGHLTSPPFKIERNHLNFLIGGGSLPGKLEIQLLVKDQVVYRSTALKNDESLKQGSWDLKGFRGQSAQIRIIDQAIGDWGHVNIDQIYQSDKKAAGSVITSYKLEPQVLAKAKTKPAPKKEPAPVKPKAEEKPAPVEEKKNEAITALDLSNGDLSQLPKIENQQIKVDFTPSKQLFTIFELNHAILRYDLTKNSLECLLKGNQWTALGVPIKPRDGKISLQLEVKKDSVEISAFNGEITGSFNTHPKQAPKTQKITGAKIHRLSVSPIERVPSASEIVTVDNSHLPFATRGEELTIEVVLRPGKSATCGVCLRSNPDQIDSGIVLTYHQAKATLVIKNAGDKESRIEGLKLPKDGNLSLQVALGKEGLTLSRDAKEIFKATGLKIPASHQSTSAFATGGRAEVWIRIWE